MEERWAIYSTPFGPPRWWVVMIALTQREEKEGRDLFREGCTDHARCTTAWLIGVGRPTPCTKFTAVHRSQNREYRWLHRSCLDLHCLAHWALPSQSSAVEAVFRSFQWFRRDLPRFFFCHVSRIMHTKRIHTFYFQNRPS